MRESDLSPAPAATRRAMPDETGVYPYLLYANGRHRQVSNACHPAESGCEPPAPEKSASETTPISAEKETVDTSDAYHMIFTYAPYVPRKPTLPVPAEGLVGWYDSPPKFHGLFRLPMPERYWLRYKTYICLSYIPTGKITGPIAIRGQNFRFKRDAHGIIRYKEPHERSGSQMIDMHFLATCAG